MALLAERLPAADTPPPEARTREALTSTLTSAARDRLTGVALVHDVLDLESRLGPALEEIGDRLDGAGLPELLGTVAWSPDLERSHGSRSPYPTMDRALQALVDDIPGEPAGWTGLGSVALDHGAIVGGADPVGTSAALSRAEALAAPAMARAEEPGAELPEGFAELMDRSQGRRLDPDHAARYGQVLGHDLSEVWIHTDEAAARASEGVCAKAFAVGTHVFFSAGSFAPGTPAGDRLLLHELTHVVQHLEGRLDEGEPRVSDPGEPAELEAAAAEAHVAQLEEVDAVETEGVPAAPATEAPAMPPPADGDAGTGGDQGPPQSGPEARGGNPDGGEQGPDVGPPAGGHQDQGGGSGPGGGQGHGPSVGPDQGGGGQSQGGGSTGAQLQSYHEVVEARRQRVVQITEDRKQRVRDNAESERTRCRTEFGSERERIDAQFLRAEKRINAAADAALEEVEADRTFRLESVRGRAETELAAVQSFFSDQISRLETAATTNAQATLDAGTAQAARVREGCADRITAAWGHNARIYGQYRDHDRQGEIARALNEMTTEAANAIREAGETCATEVLEDSQGLAQQFATQATEARGRLEEARDAAVEGIEAERDGAVQAIGEVSDGAVSSIESARNDAIGELAGLHGQASAALDRGEQSAIAEIDLQALQAEAQLDLMRDDALRQLDEAEAANTPNFEPLAGQVLEEALAEAELELDGMVTDFEGGADQVVTAMGTSLAGAVDQQLSEAASRVAEITSPLDGLVSDFEASMSTIVTDTIQRTGEIESAALLEMTALADTCGGELRGQLDTLTADWDQQLRDGIAMMVDKVETTLTAQDQLVATLASDMATKADEIANESWWSRAWNFFVGVVKGLVDRIVATFIGLIILFILAVILVVILVIIGVIVFIVGGPGAVLAYIAGLAAIGAFIAEWAVVGLVILIIIVAVLLIIELYTVFTDPSATDEERGRAVGHAIFDVVTILFGAKIAGWLGKAAGRLARLLGLVGDDAARLARLLALLGGDEARLTRFLAAFGDDAARLESILARLGGNADELERLLVVFGDDGLRLERMLGVFGDDVARMRSVLALFGDDAARLDVILGHFGGDATRLQRVLGLFGDDAATLERVLAGFGDDATRLEALLARFNNDGARLSAVLGGFGDDVARMEAAMTAFGDDAGRLGRAMAAFGDDGTRLEAALTTFGDDAARLEQALAACADDGARLEAVLTRLGNNGDKLTQILNSAPDGPAAIAFLEGLSDNGLRALDDLAPEQLHELFKRDPRILEAILTKTPEEQAAILDDVERIDEVFSPRGGGADRAGHAMTEHGPHLPDEYLFDRAANMNQPVSRWNTVDAMEDAINAAKTSTTDAAQVTALRGTDGCCINARGWREIDRGRITVQEILDDPVTHAQYLKGQVTSTGPSPGGGTMFHPDGTTTSVADNYKVILRPDDSGVYQVITAHPTP